VEGVASLHVPAAHAQPMKHSEQTMECKSSIIVMFWFTQSAFVYSKEPVCASKVQRGVNIHHYQRNARRGRGWNRQAWMPFFITIQPYFYKVIHGRFTDRRFGASIVFIASTNAMNAENVSVTSGEAQSDTRNLQNCTCRGVEPCHATYLKVWALSACSAQQPCAQ
jgi:hypothetical protein